MRLVVHTPKCKYAQKSKPKPLNHVDFSRQEKVLLVRIRGGQIYQPISQISDCISQKLRPHHANQTVLSPPCVPLLVCVSLRVSPVRLRSGFRTWPRIPHPKKFRPKFSCW